LSRRIVQGVGEAEPTIRQRGYVYQKGRKKSDPWSPKELAYGRYRVDVPGQQHQKEVRAALGYCRDRIDAMLSLQKIMGVAGVLDFQKICERITPAISFREQAAWWIAEIKAGRIVHAKKRTQIRPATIIGYETAVSYLNAQIGDMALASVDNPEAKSLIAKMRLAVQDAKPRFGDKTIVEYFSVLQKVIKSAVDDKLRQLYPRTWDLSAICLPKVNPKNQHRPTLSRKEVSDIISKSKGRYRVLCALLPGTGLRISEALSLEIKHLSNDCSIIIVKQQRDKNGQVEAYPKTDAGFREIDLDPSLAEMLRDFIGDRKEGFLFPTENGNMLNPQNIYRDAFAAVLKKVGRRSVRYHAFRRFRESVLLRSECRNILINFWIGHADSEMSSRYGMQLLEDVEFRQEWVKKVGLGFDLPTSELTLIGLRGLQTTENLKQAEVA
jgi:integrase